MLSPIKFFDLLKKNKIDFYTGIPDSLLKNFCFYVSKKSSPQKHIIAANEGSAIAIACGYNLSTSKIPVVYLQNSGLGNTVNPILSLADKKVYSIPMIVIIGWRGEPGVKDEPQHVAQGEVTIDLIKSIKKRHKILTGNQSSDLKKTMEAIKITKKIKEPVFLIVKKNTFEKFSPIKTKEQSPLSREAAIEIIINSFKSNYKIVSTTGMISRELYEIRKRNNQKTKNDFMTVGSMGHASQIALGIALNSKKNIVCLDGDGSFIMHMGGAAIIGSLKLKNYIHIVLNNYAHDSVGGQQTAAKYIDLPKLASACGYRNIFKSIKDKKSLIKSLKKIKKTTGPIFIEIIVRKGSRKNLGRPKETPLQNKKNFIENIKAR